MKARIKKPKCYAELSKPQQQRINDYIVECAMEAAKKTGGARLPNRA